VLSDLARSGSLLQGAAGVHPVALIALRG